MAEQEFDLEALQQLEAEQDTAAAVAGRRPCLFGPLHPTSNG